jgi:hypothetical protein
MKILRSISLVILILLALTASAISASWVVYYGTSDGILGPSGDTTTTVDFCDVTCNSGLCIFAIKSPAGTPTFVDSEIHPISITTGTFRFYFKSKTLPQGMRVFKKGGYFDTLTGSTHRSCRVYK